MKRYILVCAFLLLGISGAARAAEADLYCQTGTSSTGFPIFQPASATNPCPVTSAGGGGGAATIANGADVTEGAIADAAAASGGTGTVSAKLRQVTALLQSILTGPLPVSNASLPLPTGAATAANQTTSNTPPVGSTPITATATGTTGATTATLAANASLHTYICGFSIRANANAAATGNATVTGVVTATMNFTQWTSPNASGLGITEMIFSPCITSSAINTGIAVISAAPGTGGVVSVSAWGFQL